MTRSGVGTAETARLLRSAELLLLDFDGPVCSIFAGHPATKVADALRAFVARHGVALTAQVQCTGDPLQVIRHVQRTAPTGVTHQCDTYLTRLETRAVPTAVPTPGGHEFIRTSHAAGVPVVIVSNNSADAIHAYTHLHDLARQVDDVVGRPPGQPQLMKPDPWLLRQATAGRSSTRAVFVGDSISDVEAARAAHVPFIALANKPGKASRFTSQGVQCIIEDMRAIARWSTPKLAAN